MNNLETYIVKLLQGRLSEGVQVVKQFSEKPSLPVVTLDLGVSPSFDSVERFMEETEFKAYHYNSTIYINVWCNKEDDRQRICNEIRELFYMEQSHHYSYCCNYEDNDNCTYINDTCEATLGDTASGVKGRCPHPKQYGYKPLYYTCNIHPSSLVLGEPMEQDETNEKPILLHSIIPISADYYIIHNIGGEQVRNININEDGG